MFPYAKKWHIMAISTEVSVGLPLSYAYHWLKLQSAHFKLNLVYIAVAPTNTLITMDKLHTRSAKYYHFKSSKQTDFFYGYIEFSIYLPFKKIFCTYYFKAFNNISTILH